MSRMFDSRHSASAFTRTLTPASRAAVPSELVFCGNGTRHDLDLILDELLRMRELLDDWDGEGSVAPDLVLVDDVTSFAYRQKREKTAAPARVVATVNGTICLEWYTQDLLIEYEFFEPNTVNVRQMRLAVR